MEWGCFLAAGTTAACALGLLFPGAASVQGWPSPAPPALPAPHPGQALPCLRTLPTPTPPRLLATAALVADLDKLNKKGDKDTERLRNEAASIASQVAKQRELVSAQVAKQRQVVEAALQKALADVSA